MNRSNKGGQPLSTALMAFILAGTVGQSTFLLDRQLTGPWDAFVEFAGTFPARGGPQNLLHFGTALKIAKQHQLDFHVGAGLSAAAVDHFIGFGYSFRFQGFRR